MKYRLGNAKKTLIEVDVCIQNEFWNFSVNRMYYACFYAVTALLISNGFSAKSHSGVRQMFGLHFIEKGLLPPETGRFYTTLFDKRQRGDYDDYIDFDREDVLHLLPKAKELIDRIDFMLQKG